MDEAKVAELSPAGPLTVGVYMAQWLGHTKGRVRVKTHNGCQGLLRLYALPTLGRAPLDGLKPLDLQALYGDLLARGLSGGTVLNLHLVLTQALGQAVRWGILPVNPAASAQPPRPRRPELALMDPAAVERILQAIAGTPLELPVAMAVATGMRRGEILALRWKDLDPDFTVAHVRRSLQTTGGVQVFEEPKTRRSRRAVDLPAFIRPFLLRQVKDQSIRKAASGIRLDVLQLAHG